VLHIMNHMVEQDSQNDVPEEMDIAEGKLSRRLFFIDLRFGK